ncbi:MAG: amino acid racemase [Sphingobium sp.]|nr:amino acid racemase [Sphingobium sp.]MBP6112563.1 amino acid racemase [Sphingobium sp.]MBP8671855.1 amino acid racemase [Sphingobium sp.]MBP9158797.1 amino acid racemase [Sphingobium sp.]
MKKFGLIGGLSWSSTARYYEMLNKGVARRLGGLHSASLVIESLDFAEVARCTTEEDWDCASGPLIAAAQRLEAAGAQAMMICANSMHVIYDRVAEAVSVPVLHIAEAVGVKMQADGIKSAAIVGTRNVMTEKFYRQRLVSYGISLLPPDMELAERVDRIVYDELVLGKISRESERFMKSELTDIAKQQVQAVVLACTELEMIVDVRANVLPIYDSTSIHAQAALDFMLAGY